MKKKIDKRTVYPKLCHEILNWLERDSLTDKILMKNYKNKTSWSET